MKDAKYSKGQAPRSMGFSRKEHWSGLPFPSLGDLPDPEIEPHLLWLLPWQLGFFTTEPPGKPSLCIPSTFDRRDGFDVNRSHVFLQGVLAAFTLV